MTGGEAVAGDVASVLAALISARGTRVKVLSRRAGCTVGHLSNILHGRRRPSPVLSARLDAALAGGGQLTAALARTPAQQG